MSSIFPVSIRAAGAAIFLLAVAGESKGPKEQSVEQAPISFVVRNVSGQTLYLEWATGGDNLVMASFLDEELWEPIYFWPQYCTESCEYCSSSGCTSRCSIQAKSRVFENGDEADRGWSGDEVLELEQRGGSSCTVPASVKAGRYKVRACASESFTCFGGSDCTPDADGVMTNAVLAGAQRCAEAEFDVPFADAEIVLEIR